MRSSLLTLICWTLLAYGAFAQEQIDRAKYELIRETINFLATDKAVSKDTSFRVSCETLDYACFGQQLNADPIAGIGQWYNRWRSTEVTDSAGLASLRSRIFADIIERQGKGYRKQLAGYDGYVARTTDLVTGSHEPLMPVGEGDDSLLAEQVPDHAGLAPIYPEEITEQHDNPETENPMIAYLALAIGLIALIVAARPLMKKKEPEKPANFDGMEEIHRRLDGIAMRMKNLEDKVADAQMGEAVTHLTEIMESVEKRVVELEQRPNS